MGNTSPTFQGFSPEACKFLMELSYNNNTDFFHANKSRFADNLLAPMSSLVSSLHGTMKDIDPDIDTLPEYGHALVRMNRSTRFSKDKRPYKENYWCKLGVKNELDIPMFFFEIKPNSYSWGMGTYQSSPRFLTRVRDAIKAFPSAFEETIAPFYGKGALVPVGDKYKKDRAEGLSGGAHDFCNRKDMALVAEVPADELLFSPALAEFLKDEFKKLSGLYRLLMKIYNEDR